MARHSIREDVDGSELVFATRGLSETEVAAVTAVLTAALREQAAEDEPTPDAVTSAWQRSQRNLRSPLAHGGGVWRSFG